VIVDANPATAPWTFTDGEGGEHSGTGPKVVEGVQAGDITFTWLPLTGSDLPSPVTSTKTLEVDGSVTFSGFYTRHVGSVAVTITPDGARNLAAWSFADADGGVHEGLRNATRTGIPTGTATMTWQSVPNYDLPVPNPATQSVTRNGTANFTGAYTRHAGTVAIDVTPDSAPWSFTDGDGGVHTGTGDATRTSIPSGTVALTWQPLAGFSAPANPASQVLVKGGTVSFTGTFEATLGSVAVNVTPDSASWSFTDSIGGVHTGTGDATRTGIPTGTVTLTWQPLAGFAAPAPNPESKTLVQDATVTFTGQYTSSVQADVWMMY
jgi:hypothetical protein